MSSCGSGNTSSGGGGGYGDNLYFPGAAQATDLQHHQGSLLGKVEGAGLGSVYSRHPYDSWPFNTMAGAQHHAAMKGDSVNTGECRNNSSINKRTFGNRFLLNHSDPLQGD